MTLPEQARALAADDRHWSGTSGHIAWIGEVLMLLRDTADALDLAHADAAAMREALVAAQWDCRGKCPVCAGWNVGPYGETERKHTGDCPVGKALSTTAGRDMLERVRKAEAGHTQGAACGYEDLRCQDCHGPHPFDCSLPSDIWNQIADPSDMLCFDCIDKRLLAKGLTAECELYAVGKALRSKLYGYSFGERQAAEARLATAEADARMLRAGLLRTAIIADYDYPGDAPELAGYSCTLCNGYGVSPETVEHKGDCVFIAKEPTDG